jgi:hypothetical protein
VKAMIRSSRGKRHGAHWLALLCAAIWASATVGAHQAAPPGVKTTTAPTGGTAASAAAVDSKAVDAIGKTSTAAIAASKADLDAVTEVSNATIAAAKDEIDQTKWVFAAGSVVISLLLAGAGFLGFQNVKGIAESVKREARSRIDGELHAFRETVNAAAELAVRTQAALRMAYLAEKWSESEDNRFSCFARAIGAIRDARSAAIRLDDIRTVAWTHSFEAYCLRGQERYGEAVTEQLIAVQSEERDPLDLYNLACYQALSRQPEQAKRTLEAAIGTAGERFRRHAAGDPDFAAMRASGALNELLKGVVAEEPDKSVPPVPKAPG